MAEVPRPAVRRPPAAGILLCLSVATAGQAAYADDTGAGTAQADTSSGPITATPSLLPATGPGASAGANGPDVRLGNFGNRTNQPLQPASRAWTFSPSLGLTEEAITGQSGIGAAGGGQFITSVQPGLLAGGDSVRLHGELSYTPQIQFYVPDGTQNQVAQNFNGRLLATVVPGTLFLDLRGAASVQAIAAGQAPSQTSSLGRGTTTQTYSFSASPYALHRFGEWGTGELGGSIARTLQNALSPASLTASGSGDSSSAGLAALADSSNQNVTSTGGHIAFVTGEAFARYSGTALAQTENFAGSGVLSGAWRDTASVDNGYAITRQITALAMLGWESIHYAGSDPVHIDGAIWNVGLRLEPGPSSTFTVRYGHQDGLDSFTVDAALQPSARTRILARLSTGLSTDTEQLQNALATADLDTQANPTDHSTGAPLLPVGGFFGIQNSLYKTTLASLTAMLLFDRDSLSASLSSQTQTLVSAGSAAGLAGGNTSGLYGTLTWSHALQENLQGTVYMEYGTTHSDGPAAGLAVAAGSSQLAVVSVSLSYALSATLSGRLLCSYTQNFGASRLPGEAAGGTAQGLVLASLVKSF